MKDLHCGRKRQTTLVILLTCAICNCVTIPIAAQDWRILGELREGRHSHAAFPLSEDQTLVIGGWGNSTASGSGTPLRSCEIIDLDARLISSATPMNVARADFAALPLPNGDVIVIGGISEAPDVVSASIERYNVQSQSWTEIGNLVQARAACHAAFVNESTILVFGGRIDALTTVNTYELVDLNTGDSQLLGAQGSPLAGGFLVNPGNGNLISAPLLGGGRTGGSGSQRNSQMSRYNGGSDWEVLSDLIWNDNLGGFLPQALKLWSGDVLISGGSVNEFPINFRDDVVSIDASYSTQTIGAMSSERILHTMIQLNDERVLITGGRNQSGATLNQTDYFTLQDGNWSISAGPLLNAARRYGVGVSMPQRDGGGAVTNGRVLLIGGFRGQSNLASIEILEEIPSVDAPVIFNVIESCTSVTFCVSDPTNVVQIQNRETANINLFTDTIISTKVTVTVSLDETREPNNFDIRIVNTAGNETIFTGLIDFGIQPLPRINAERQGICLGETLELGVEGVYDAYLWSTGETGPTIEVSPDVDTRYTVELLDPQGCVATSAPFDLQVFVAPETPELTENTPSFTLCEGSGDSLVLSVATLYDNYAWYVDEQLVSNEPTLVVKESSTIYLEVSSGPGCTSRSEIVFVNVTGDRIGFPTVENGRHFMECAASTGSVYCEEFPVINLSEQILGLDRQSVRAFGNNAFSLPLGQFSTPDLKQVGPGQTAMLTVCYAPRRLGFSKVDILVNGNCNVTAFEVVCAGIQPREFSGLSDCNVAVSAVSAGFNLPPIGEAIISPNPTRDHVDINIDVTDILVNAFVPDALVFDALGRMVQSLPPRQLQVHFGNDDLSDVDRNTSANQRHIANYGADVRQLPTGMYHLVIPGLQQSYLLAVER